MTIEEAKNIVAVKHGYENFNEVIAEYDKWNISRTELYKLQNEAALLHTKYHVEQALKAASVKLEDNFKTLADYKNAKNSILNAYSIENIQ